MGQSNGLKIHWIATKDLRKVHIYVIERHTYGKTSSYRPGGQEAEVV